MKAALAAGLGDRRSEKILHGLLLLTVFVLPLGTVIILNEQLAEVAGRYNTFAVPKLYLVEALIVLAGAMWALVTRPKPAALKPFIGLAAVVGMAFLSVLWAPSALLAVTSAGHAAIALILLVVAADRLRHPGFARLAAAVFIGSALVQAGWAGGQYLAQHDFGLQRVGESVLGPGVPNVAKIDVGGDKLIRGYGSLPHPNILAVYLAAAIFLVGTLVFWPMANRTRSRQLVVAGILVVLGAGLLVTFSRTAILLTVVNGTLVGFFSWWHWRRLPWGAGAAAIVVLAFGIVSTQPLASRATVNSATETGLSNRTVGYELGLEMLANRPLGVGAGSFVLAARELRDDLPGYQYQPAHNAVLLIAAELSLVAAIIVVAFIVRLGWRFHRHRPTGREANTLNFSLFMLGGVLIGTGMVDHFFWSTPAGLWLVVLFAAAIMARLPLAAKRPRHR